MNRRSFLRGLLGATALVPLAKIASPQSLYETYEFSGFESRIPISALTMTLEDYGYYLEQCVGHEIRIAPLNAP